MTQQHPSSLLFLILGALLISCVHSDAGTPIPTTPTQAPQAGTNPTPVQPPPTPLPEAKSVHFVMHSHDDVGWLTTVDGYFHGNAGGVYPTYACVNCTLTESFKALQQDPKRIFNVVEMKFFAMWYYQLTPADKEKAKALVKNGQFYILNGGYVMNDEGAAYYEDIIEQFYMGHKFAIEEFGVQPKVGWHIDPFGHSGGMAAIFGQMGYDGWFIERIDYLDLALRKTNREMEFVMKPTSAVPELNQQFVHINAIKYHAWPLDNMCSGNNCNNMGNAQGAATSFNRTAHNDLLKWYKHPIIFHHIGDDFEVYKSEHYQAMEKMMEIMNKKEAAWNWNSKFSTPQNYLDDVYEYSKKNKIDYSIKSDDFFPYQDNPAAYWTGYFTSRPFLKYLIRQAGRVLRVARKFFAIEQMHLGARTGNLNNSRYAGSYDALFPLADAVALCQHHDAITGTAKTFVNNDYIKRINEGFTSVRQFLSSSLGMGEAPVTIQCVLGSNHDLSDEECPEFYTALINKQVTTVKFRLIVFNPRDNDTALIRLPMMQAGVEVSRVTGEFSASGEAQKEVLTSYTVCNTTPPIRDLSGRYKFMGGTPCELLIPITIPAHQTVELNIFLMYHIQPDTSKITTTTLDKTKPFELKIDNETQLTIQPDFQTFTLRSKHFAEYRKETRRSKKFTLTYKCYLTGGGNGAYLLRPQSAVGTNCQKIQNATVVETPDFFIVQINAAEVYTKLYIMKGPSFSENGIQIMSLVPALTGPKEVALHIKVHDFQTEGVFYTDQMGLEMIRRINNYRPIPINITDSIGGNYYPMYTSAYLEDEATNYRVLLMSDRSQGVASFFPGELEINIQRRSSGDDGRGLGEAHIDDKPLITYHNLFIGKSHAIRQAQRKRQIALEQPLLLMVASVPYDESARILSRPEKKRQNPFNRTHPMLKTNFLLNKDVNQLVVSLQNMDPKKTMYLPLITNKDESPIIEYLVGDSYDITVGSWEERTITGLEKLESMLTRRKYWDCLDGNLTECQNDLKDKAFYYTVKNATNQEIAIRPLQTRVFAFDLKGVKVREFKPVATEEELKQPIVVTPTKPTIRHEHHSARCRTLSSQTFQVSIGLIMILGLYFMG